MKDKRATCGEKKKNDARVSVKLVGDEIRIDLESKNTAMFGRAIKKAVHDVCDAYNVKGAEVTIEDEGALDFAIRARLATAIERAIENE